MQITPRSCSITACARWSLLALLAGFVPGLRAQAAGTGSPAQPKPAAAGEAIELSAFEVRSERDNSYGALNSNSITRFNVEMDKMPVSADIFTETFMRDVGTSSVEDVIRDYSAGAGYADGSNNGAATAADNQPGDRVGNSYIQIRGMMTPTMQRDGFMPVGSFSNPGSTAVGRTDNFDVERVEVINGPQALLYGGGGAGGVINVTSKQARFGPRDRRFFRLPSGSLLFRIDDFGTRRGELDFGLGNHWFAARVSLLRQREKTRRDIIGSETDGQYVQLAFRAFQETVPTTLRLSGSFTQNDRWLSRAVRLTAPADPRNNMYLTYLLETGQAGATNPATGAAYPRGAILNGNLTWENVDSLVSGIMQQEPTTNDFTSVTADTKWSSWLTTQVAGGYNVYTGRRGNPGTTFFAPRSGANNTDDWAVGLTPQDSWQPSRSKGGRIAALITKDFLNGRAKTQTLLGMDYIWQMHSQIGYRWYEADANWNLRTAPGSTITSANSGRTILNQVIWPVNNGPVFRPFPDFDLAGDRGTIAGVNYVRALQNPAQRSLESPANPLGTPTSGNYILTKLLNRGFYGVNYTQWFDGKINTLIGVRQGDYVSDRLQHPESGRTRYLADSSATNFNVGVDWSVNRWLHPYVNYSDSIMPPYVGNRVDPHNEAPKNAKGRGGEVGLKLNNSDNSLSGNVAFFESRSKDDLYAIGGSVRDLISPNGLNGGEGGASVAIDRYTRGLDLRVTAAPTRNWRLRFGASWQDGEIETTKAYEQRYNDQFYANAAGQVTYRNGTVVYVNGGAGNATQATVVAPTAPGAVPLTINLLSTPGAANLYYANPDPTSGAIDAGSIAGRILSGQNNAAAINANGPILTGVTGLPISELQLNEALAGINTPGIIVATRVGDKTTGYPEYSANFTSNYRFSGDTWLNGLSVGGSLIFSWKNRGYYYYAAPLTRANALTLQRTLLYTPDRQQVNVFASYARKIGRFEWITQLNVSNLFDDYERTVIPDATTGFSNLTNLRVTWYGQPRTWQWTNTIKF